jgi:hypothetical protein
MRVYQWKYAIAAVENDALLHHNKLPTHSGQISFIIPHIEEIPRHAPRLRSVDFIRILCYRYHRARFGARAGRVAL